MIVVDTNVIGYLLLTGERSHQAQQALQKDRQWVAPHLWRSEFRNILSRYLRKQHLNLEDALSIMAQAERMLQDREYDVDSGQVLSLAEASSATAYDCEFIALARSLGIQLVTADGELIRKFPGTAVSLDAFVL